MTVLDGKLFDIPPLTKTQIILLKRPERLFRVLRGHASYPPGTALLTDVRAAQNEWKRYCYYCEWALSQDPEAKGRIQGVLMHNALHSTAVCRTALKTECAKEFELLLAIARAFPDEEDVWAAMDNYAAYVETRVEKYGPLGHPY